MGGATTSLYSGLKIAVSSVLAGGKRAVRMGDTVYVSPAMYDLIKSADEKELRLLLEKIEMITIPEPPSIFGPLPMTARPPEPSLTDWQSIARRYGL